MVTACNGFLQLFSLDKNYFEFAITTEQLKTEGWQFFQLSGKYDEFEDHKEAYKPFCKSIENINISEEFVEFLLNDLNLVTNPGGTAYRSFQIMGDQIFDIGGKTGTAQNAGELNNTSWFVGVDSISNPMYIVVTVVEEGGSGSAVAAPISRRIIQHLIESDLTPVEFGEITE